ncbi:MAG: hypothetical protein MRJ65_06440 [Candidatus Brocadiaceae bacterium]|nr:hypothetical protein [Candidatus Brocadiaceae bacterium]
MTHKKTTLKLAVSAVIAVGAVAFVLTITVTRQKQTQFCINCHNTVTFNNKCADSLTNAVGCVECHSPKDNSREALTVEIKDERCTSESCHPVNRLPVGSLSDKTMKPFQHATHIDAFSANLKLRCTSCHAYLGGEKHFELDMDTCTLCHFLSTRQTLQTEDNKPISECTVCHGTIEKTKEIYEKTFEHATYENKEGVRCSDCHFETVQGHGAVDEANCYRCHTSVTDNYGNASDMHYNHIILRKTGCVPCHNKIKHGWTATEKEIDRKTNNQSPVYADYKIQQMIFRGTGGLGIKDEPDPMYLATLNCSGCHKEPFYSPVNANVCNNCHEKGFVKILREQLRFVTREMRALSSLLKQAKKHSYGNTNAIINEAETNYRIIKEDGSFGAHNIKYVKDLLSYSREQLEKIIQNEVIPNSHP